MSNKNDWCSRIQDTVSECSNMYTRGVLFQCVSTIKIKRKVLVEYKQTLSSSHRTQLVITMVKLTILDLALNNNNRLTHLL